MSRPVQVLVLIHGMTPGRKPSSPVPTYDAFWQALQRSQPSLSDLIDERTYVEWGHELDLPTPSLRPDQLLTRAEAFAYDRVAYERVRATPGPNNVIMTGLFGSDWGIPGLRQVVMSLRQGVVLFGLSDVVYYCSADGERQVRRAVYEQVLARLAKYEDEPDVRLHVFAHSLGVTVAHDFLFGLFNRDPGYRPDFVEEAQGSGEAQQRFLRWREKVQRQELRLGAFATAASQLPLTTMRKQKSRSGESIRGPSRPIPSRSSADRMQSPPWPRPTSSGVMPATSTACDASA